jgi:hypothetical protein
MQPTRKAAKRFEIAGGRRVFDYLSNIKRMDYTPLVNRTKGQVEIGIWQEGDCEQMSSVIRHRAG